MTTANDPDVSLGQFLAEARLRYPNVDLLESISAGCQALEMASDCNLDYAQREAARRHGFDVALWLMSLIDAARARQGAGPERVGVVQCDHAMKECFPCPS
jgi:hypothetical protein